LSRLFLGRTCSRLFGVFAILFLVLAWRLDQAARTAYASGWTAAIIGLCRHCRLPGEDWAWAHLTAGVLAVAFMIVALVSYLGRVLRDAHPTEGETAASFAARKLQLELMCGSAAAAALACEIVAAVFRSRADGGDGSSQLRYALALDVAALALLAVFVVAVATFAAASQGGFGHELRLFIQRHRVNLAGVVFFALVLDVVGQTSGQAIDSIRTWVVWDSPHVARLAFGLGSTTLLALVVYESGVRLNQIDSTAALTRRQRRDSGVPGGGRVRWWWLEAGGALFAAGMLLPLVLPIGYGIAVLGGIFLLLGVLELPAIDVPTRSTGAPAAPEANEDGGDATEAERAALAPEYLAIVPPLAIGTVALASFIEAALSDGARLRFDAFAVLIPGLMLAALTVVMTRTGQAPDLPSIPLRSKQWPFTAVAVAAVVALLLAAGSAALTAVVGFVLFGLAFAYAVVLFRGGTRALRIFRPFMIARPFAVCAGIAVLLVIEGDVRGVSKILGVFGLVNVALAAFLALLHYVVSWSLEHRPPRFLYSIGIEQLPILSLLLIWWVGAGLIAFPRSVHDVRVDAYATPAGIPSPTLQNAFDEWRAAQGDLWTRSSSTSPPLPLVLVASHGGGIRAAYWTALALDCAVAGEAEPESPDSPDYGKTCTDQRRSADAQLQAARSIFLASGVSGGAVGLYAYARELLAQTQVPLDTGWVDAHLGSDHASATVAWGLFHDLPNHLLGLRPGTGGTCGRHEHINAQCIVSDRSAALEDSFDRTWNGGPEPTLRENWDGRFSGASSAQVDRSRAVPILVFNSTVVGGQTRAVTSAVRLADWPQAETTELTATNAIDQRPLAGTGQVLSALCSDNDLRLSSAALLAGRFPYVSPSGRVNGHCAPNVGDPALDGACANAAIDCRMSLVDGGYTDNSGLFTIEALVPSIRRMIEESNAAFPNRRQIALVIVELDNHYRASVGEVPKAGSNTGESLVPPLTGIGGHQAIETFARADAYRLTPAHCTMTISPALHPGLEAPLGWELSKYARVDLQNGLVRNRDNLPSSSVNQPLALISRLQQWLGGQRMGADVDLGACVPRNPPLGP
jgi:hypothetical protein